MEPKSEEAALELTPPAREEAEQPASLVGDRMRHAQELRRAMEEMRRRRDR